MAIAREVDRLFLAAREAPPQTRILFRDEIAAHDEVAIHRLAGEAWVISLRPATRE